MLLVETRGAYEQWLGSTRDLSAHTVRAYISDVFALEIFLGATFDAAQITSDDLHRFVAHLSSTGCSSTTIRRRVSGLRGFCGWLANNNVLEANPASELNVRFSRPRRLPRAISTSDLTRLVRYLSASAEVTNQFCGPQTGERRDLEATTLIAVLLMVGTGMRVGELTQTRLSQVDLPSRTIRVVGKGLRERMVYLSNDWIVGLLDFHLQQRDIDAGHDSQLLVNRSGRPLTTSALRSRLARAAVAAGISTHLTPHMLRHTAATQLIEAGVDIRFVQRLLGHASLTTTEIYTHVADRSLRHAVTEADVLGQFVTLR